MAELKSMWHVAIGTLRESFSDARPYFVALMVLALMHLASSDVRSLCAQYDAKATILPLFVFVFNTTYYIITLNFLFLVLVCDIPLRKGHQRYIVLRCGRCNWAGGQILYLIMMTTIFLIWVFLATVIVMWGHLSLSLDWGRVYYSLARIKLQGGLVFSQAIQNAFSASDAFLFCFGLQWLCSMLFGLIIYVLNLVTGKNIGMIIPCVFLLLYFRIMQFIVGSTWTVWISPVYLSRLNRYTAAPLPGVPDACYALLFFLLGIAILCFCCVELARRRHGGIEMHK